jgi:major membrane immunogen (membrane-anchored lipoprotein)
MYRAKVKEVRQLKNGGYMVTLENRRGEWKVFSKKEVPEGKEVKFKAHRNEKGNWIIDEIEVYESSRKKEGEITKKDLTIIAQALAKSWAESVSDKQIEDLIEAYKKAYAEIESFHRGISHEDGTD